MSIMDFVVLYARASHMIELDESIGLPEKQRPLSIVKKKRVHLTTAVQVSSCSSYDGFTVDADPTLQYCTS